jgi:hypothetical protein
LVPWRNGEMVGNKLTKIYRGWDKKTATNSNIYDSK